MLCRLLLLLLQLLVLSRVWSLLSGAAYPLSSPPPPPPAAAVLSGVCSFLSGAACDLLRFSNIFFLLFATSSFLISFVNCCCFSLLIIISALKEQLLGDHAESNSFSSFHHQLWNCSNVRCCFTDVWSSPRQRLPLSLFYYNCSKVVH